MSRLNSCDTIPAIVAASQAASDIAQLSADLALARDDGTGVYGDACRHQLGLLDDRLAVVRATIAALPTVKREAA